MCIMNMHIHGCVYVFLCFICYFWDWQWLRHSVYIPYYSLIRRIECIYNRFPCEVAVPYKNALSHGLLTGFADWYMYVYMYLWEKRRCRLTVWLYVFGEKWICHDTLNFYSFCFIFRLKVTCSLHVLHLWYRKTMPVKKTFIILFCIKEKQLRCDKYFYCVFIIVRGTTTSWSSLITICYSPFLQKFI